MNSLLGSLFKGLEINGLFAVVNGNSNMAPAVVGDRGMASSHNVSV